MPICGVFFVFFKNWQNCLKLPESDEESVNILSTAFLQASIGPHAGFPCFPFWGCFSSLSSPSLDVPLTDFDKKNWLAEIDIVSHFTIKADGYFPSRRPARPAWWPWWWCRWRGWLAGWRRWRRRRRRGRRGRGGGAGTPWGWGGGRITRRWDPSYMLKRKSKPCGSTKRRKS